MPEFQINAVPASAVLAHWKVIDPMLAGTLPAGLDRLLPIDILVMLIQGAAQAWFVTEGEELLAVSVTKIDIYPRKRVFNVFALAGKRMNKWFGKFDETLTGFAKQSGCNQVEIVGRKGWEKVLGFEPRATFLVKDLTPDTERVQEKEASI